MSETIQKATGLELLVQASQQHQSIMLRSAAPSVPLHTKHGLGPRISVPTKAARGSFQATPTVQRVAPRTFHTQILASRGYEATPIHLKSERTPTLEQVMHYDHLLLDAVRNSDLHGLEDLLSSGKTMSACNKYSESILHMACRRSTAQVVGFLLENGASMESTDDYGRTPAHDACWRTEPDFELITLILDHNSELLRCVDDRGSSPLDYVREEHWAHWCQFLYRNQDKYWPIRDSKNFAEAKQDDTPTAQVAEAASKEPR